MPITFQDDSATIGTTEYYLASDSTSKSDQTTKAVVQLFLDLNALAAGDQFELKFYEKVNGGTSRNCMPPVTFSGAQSPPHFVAPALVLGDGWEFSLKKLAGTDRSIPWSIRKVA